jgi:long-chain acyl-CoA synthetase
MNLSILLTNVARAIPDAPAIYHGDALYLTFGELARRASRLAAVLAGHGVLPGDRIVVYAPNHPDYIPVMWATWMAGACLVPVNSKLHPKELAYVMGHCLPQAVLVSAETRAAAADAVEVSNHRPALLLLEELDERLAPVAAGHETVPRAESDPAWIFYTSGTTGRPKGATLSHRNLLASTLRYYADVDFVDESDRMLHLAPLSHGSGLYSLPLLAKGAAQVVPASGGFDAAEVYELLRHHRKVTTFLAPTMVNRLVQHPGASAIAPDAWQTIFYGGAPMYVADIKRALAAFGPVFWQGYGQGETPCTIAALSKRAHADATHPRYEERLASVGTARTGVEVRVVDGQMQPLPAGQVGEVIVRSDVTMFGYWQDPAATAAAIRDGWLHTGDIGCLSDDGYLTLKDRSKDLIISGGSNIYPREIEEVLLTHPHVREASVIGVPDPEWGESVVAYVVSRLPQAPDVADLDRFCMDHIARFKRPRHYRFVSELPKSAYGKILKSALREQWQRASSPFSKET